MCVWGGCRAILNRAMKSALDALAELWEDEGEATEKPREKSIPGMERSKGKVQGNVFGYLKQGGQMAGKSEPKGG